MWIMQFKSTSSLSNIGVQFIVARVHLLAAAQVCKISVLYVFYAVCNLLAKIFTNVFVKFKKREMA